jgi:hypothetical protein
MVKKNAHNPIREKWVINHLREWDKEHPDLNNTISNINAEVAEFADCEFYPKCLAQDVNRCYVRKRTCLNIRKV